MRDFVESFDITGRLQVDIQATFPYFGQLNPLRVVFVQSTILNQADIGNELVLAAWMSLEHDESDFFGKRMLELGSGLGTAGLVAAALGAAEAP
eukprot:Skav231295  [mRNA]  locus=scaffold161:249564:252132:+ [translate_table: standard]